LRILAWLVLALLPLCAGGCALPAGVVIASYAADGVSYIATGKSVTDHGLSAGTGHDCALLRPIFHQKPICDTTPTEQGKTVVVEQGHASAPRLGDTTAAPPPPATAARYVTVGSFLDPDNAAREKRRYGAATVSVVPVEVGGRRFHRVIVGPLTPHEAAALKARLSRAG